MSLKAFRQSQRNKRHWLRKRHEHIYRAYKDAMREARSLHKQGQQEQALNVYSEAKETHKLLLCRGYSVTELGYPVIPGILINE